MCAKDELGQIVFFVSALPFLLLIFGMDMTLAIQ